MPYSLREIPKIPAAQAKIDLMSERKKGYAEIAWEEVCEHPELCNEYQATQAMNGRRDVDLIMVSIAYATFWFALVDGKPAVLIDVEVQPGTVLFDRICV